MNQPTLEIDQHEVRRRETTTRLKARVIIPVWGAKYVARLDAACLPALLAPGNLPHLAKHFDCELVIVTQAELFDTVRSLRSVRAAEAHCSLRLIAMDDVLSHPHFYGFTITHSLYRGVTELGEAAKDVWCVFLNADFILADGSYRAMVKRMLEGERCILAPSYCAVEEDVRPVLNAKLAADGGALSLPQREMAALILDHRHFTIRAKTINSRMFRIDHVDQLYYQLNEDTLLGRQIPIAVVAFRPERVPLEPVGFWDYGVISEFCPTSKLCVLGDSDDFLMMELRGRRAMSGWLKLGWMDKAEIARSLSNWMTPDQQRCGAYTLMLHRAQLPANLEDGKRELSAYYDDVMNRLGSDLRDYREHHIWTDTVELHNEWLKNRSLPAGAGSGKSGDGGQGGPEDPDRSFIALTLELLVSSLRAVLRGRRAMIYRPLFDLMRAAYLWVFGRIPDVGLLHPRYADLNSALREVRTGAALGPRTLAIWTLQGAAIAPYLGRWAKQVVNAEPAEILSAPALESLRAHGPFDFCFVEVSREELTAFGALHARLRTLMRKGGQVSVFYQTHGLEQIVERDFQLISGALPDRDMGLLELRGGFLSYTLQRVWDEARTRAQSGRARDLVWLAFIAAIVGPLAAIANRRALKRDPGRFAGHCTSLLLTVTVV